MRKVPYWLKKNLSYSEEVVKTKEILRSLKLKTVCESSLCPNLNECFSRLFATFLVLGDTCTRNCRFCSTQKGRPHAVDADEPSRICVAVKKLGLEFVVITSVTRDDLPDGGATHFTRVIEALRSCAKDLGIEVLVPDFKGSPEEVRIVVDSGPDIFSHNMETVPRLYKTIRPEADYGRSLRVIEKAKETDKSIVTKSAILVGLGEGVEEVLSVIEDLKNAGCDILAIGQYLQPTKAHVPIRRYVPPEEFLFYEEFARTEGFKYVKSGPFVRSSYFADKIYAAIKKEEIYV